VNQAASPSLANADTAFAAETLGTVFLHSALRHADRTAVWTDEASLTYRELAELACGIAHTLIDSGLADGTHRCGVLGSRGLADYAGLLGASLARCTYVPLNLRHPPQRLAAVIADAALDAIVVSRSGLEAARELLSATPRGLLVLLPELSAAPGWACTMQHRFLCGPDFPRARPERLPRGQGEDGAYLLFTSGSTGAPKGVLVRNRNALPYLRWANDRYQPRADDRFTQLFDLTFDLSVHDLFLCWGAGGTLYRVPDRARFVPRDFVRRHELTMWFSVPSTAATMLGLRALRPGDFPSLRQVSFCGEALPTRLATAFADAAPNAVIDNIYGPTEATIAITAFRLPPDASGLPEVMPIGEAFPQQHAEVVDADGQRVMDDAEGELCLAGSQITDGYWRRPDLTEQRFVRFPWDPRSRLWYRTGDRARRSAEHGLLFLGRLDRQVKINGHRIELQEVEAVLHQAGAGNAAAIAWPIGAEGLARGIIGFIGRSEHSAEAVLDSCRRHLPPYAVPSAVHLLDEWPTNTSGKTDYGRLRQIVETPQCPRT
jgi:amino acid adenylation domain-containing protein